MSGRSHLYVPGDQANRLQRATERGADALIVDLEDGVAPQARAEARRIVGKWLASVPGAHASGGRAPVEVWVRVNPVGSARPEDLREDLAVAVAPGVTGICLAKAQSADELVVLDELLANAEARAAIAENTLRVSAIIESARGLVSAVAIAGAPRVQRLQIGEVDLSAELGLTPGPDEIELLPLRTQVVVASAAAGIGAPLGPISTNFTDLVAFRAGTERLKRLGFGGRAVIHPAQVPVVHDVFTPTAEELSRARDLVERFEAAAAKGTGVLVDERGRMVDEAVVRAARNVLSRQDGTGTG